jgi:DNA-binding MarR family transcriptional regulator
MRDTDVVDQLERIVVAGVALTTLAIGGAVSGADLTMPQWRVMVILGLTIDGAIVSEVAAAIGVTLPATSRQLRRLAVRGLVELRPDERDRRAIRARLTPAGIALRQAVMTDRRERIGQALADVTVDARTNDDLRRLADALGSAALPTGTRRQRAARSVDATAAP